MRACAPKSNVTYAATATDNCPGATYTCSPVSGSTFAKGTNSVTCMATDASGNTALAASQLRSTTRRTP